MAKESKKIFVDGSFFISFIDRADLNHNKCVPIFEYLGRHGYEVYTSNHVIFQTYSKLEKMFNKEIALSFLGTISESNIYILYSTKPEMNSIFRFLRSSNNQEANLSEVINAVLMLRNGVEHILTYDFWPNILGSQKSPLIS